MGKIGLQKKQRPGHDGLVRTASGLDGGMPNLPPNAQPYTAIPPHMQAQMQNFNFDQVGENQSMISNTVISEPCTNKRSKPEMASSSQIGLRSVFHQHLRFLSSSQKWTIHEGRRLKVDGHVSNCPNQSGPLSHFNLSRPSTFYPRNHPLPMTVYFDPMVVPFFWKDCSLSYRTVHFDVKICPIMIKTVRFLTDRSISRDRPL